MAKIDFTVQFERSSIGMSRKTEMSLLFQTTAINVQQIFRQ